MIRRYPYEALPRVAGSEQNTWRQLRLHLPEDGADLRRWGERCLASGDLRLRALGLGAEGAALAVAWRSGVRFTLCGSGGLESTLVLGGGLATSLLRRMLGTSGEGPRGNITAGEWGLLAFGLAWLLSSVKTACPWSIAGDPPAEGRLAESAEGAITLEVAVELGEEAGQAWLIMPRATLVALPQREIGGELHLPAARLDGALVSMAVEAGRASLPLEDVTSLAVGDVVLFSACPPASAGSYSIWLQCGHGGFAATFEGEELTLDTDFQGGQPPMKIDDQRGPTLAESIDVELVVELGRVEMSAAEAMTLGKGDVVTLRRALVKPVDLRVGGKLIGRAELMDVDGEAGVRVVELFDLSDAP